MRIMNYCVFLVFCAWIAISLTGCGPKGDKGDPGSNGAQGIQGNVGPNGPQGDPGLNGINGTNGSNGANGHSLVSQYVEPSELMCPNGGTELDIYLDTDNSLDVSEGDLYQNSIVACNGANGLNGVNGLDGTNGANGADGQNGANGADGAQGIPGAQGPQGVAGPQGATGHQGIAGPTGPAGPSGPQGVQGPAGPSGASISSYSGSSCMLVAGSLYYVKAGSESITIYSSSACNSPSKVLELTSNKPSFWVTTNKLMVYAAPNYARVITFN